MQIIIRSFHGHKYGDEMSVSIDLQGKNILVTGASSGIGKACASFFSECGANLILVSRREDCMKDIAEELASECAVVPFDLSSHESKKVIFDVCRDKEWKLDGFLYAAGTIERCPVKAYQAGIYEKSMQLHCFSFLEMCRYFCNRLYSNDGASVVAISSMSAQIPERGLGPYCIAKSALNMAVQMVALENVHRKIRVNSLMAAMVDTPLIEEYKRYRSVEEEELLENQPFGLIKPESIAYMAGFLMSEESEYITGARIPVGAGLI